MPMKIGLLVVLYSPQEGDIQNLKKYDGLFEMVFIYDNTDGSHQNELLISTHFPGFTYLSPGKNAGLAKALNEVAQRSISEGLDRLITMDQDSEWDIAQLQNYIHCIRLHSEDANTAMYGVSFDEMAPVSEPLCSPVKSATLITSGSCINLHVYQKLPGFDENLFVDRVDTDFCLSATTLGYELKVFRNIYLKHRIGLVYEIKIWDKPRLRSIHAPYRLYYMVRNHLYIRRKYRAYKKEFSGILRLEDIDLLNRIKNNILYNTQRWSAVKYLLLGLFDYTRGKMGNLDG